MYLSFSAPVVPTPTPGVEPGLPPRQGEVIAVRPRRHNLLIVISFLKLTNKINLKFFINHEQDKVYIYFNYCKNMTIEKILNKPLEIGRTFISYSVTDPVGEISLFTAYKFSDNSLIISVPLFLFSFWHVPHMIYVRKRLDEAVKKSGGLSKDILRQFNKNSWCSHRVAIAYTFGQGKYNEFKDLLNEYSLGYYAKRLLHNLKRETLKIFKYK